MVFLICGTAIFLLTILLYPIFIFLLVFFPMELSKFVKKAYVNLALFNWLKTMYNEI